MLVQACLTRIHAERAVVVAALASEIAVASLAAQRRYDIGVRDNS